MFLFLLFLGPHKPVDVQVAFDSGALRATISCTPSEGASSYIMETYSGTSKLNCSTTSTSCTIASLVCGAEYSLVIVASNEAGSSTPTEPVIFKTGMYTDPPVICFWIQLWCEETQTCHIVN